MGRIMVMLMVLAIAGLTVVEAANELAAGTETRIALAAKRRASGRAQEGLKLVAPYAEMIQGNLAEPRLDGYLEAVRCEMALERPRSAYKLLDYAKHHAVGIAGVRVRIIYADIVEAVPDVPKAIAYIKDAIAYGDGAFKRHRIKGESDSDPGKLEAAGPGHERWTPLRRELSQRLAGLERQLRIDRWGLDYVLYLEAQQARRAGEPQSRDFTNIRSLYASAEPTMASSPSGRDHAWALKTYLAIIEAFPESVFAEAAGLYAGVCLGKMGKVAEARRTLKTFIDRAPEGLYRGEAWETLGNLYLQADWDVRQARACYEEAATWCRRARGRAEAAALYAVPEACRQPARPPDAWQRMVCGVVEELRPRPGAVINRLTADWYLDRLEERCLFSLGFLSAVDKDWDTARATFGSAAALDPLLQSAEKNGYLNCMRRLQAACEKQAFVGTAEEDRGLLGRRRTAMMWADFAYVRRQFSLAASWYERLYRSARERKDHEVMARAGLGVMLVAMQRGDTGRARSVCEQIVKSCPKAAAAPYALFLYGHTYGPDADGSYATAISWYQRSYQRYPRSRVAEMARFYEIFKGPHAEPGKLEGLIRRFRRDFPRSDYIGALDQRLELAKDPPRV